MSSLRLLTVTLCLLSPGAALAQTPSETARVEVSAAADVLYSPRDRCVATSSDTVGCRPGVTWTGLHVAPRWRALEWLSVGALGGIAWWPASERGSASDDTPGRLNQRLMRLSLEGRVHPFSSGPVEPWLGVEAGVASVRESLSYDGGRPSDVVSRTGPMGTIAIGIERYVLPSLAAGVELRGFAVHLGDSTIGASGVRATMPGTTTGALLSVGVTLRL